jgi:hypothetical protein
MGFFAGCRMTKKGYPFFDTYQSTFNSHLKDFSPKDLLFYCYLKGRGMKRRFFAWLRMTMLIFGTFSSQLLKELK